MSYTRLQEQGEKFYQKFYDNLCQPSDREPRLGDIFKKYEVNWKRQYRALDSAVCRLLNFSHKQADAEPTSLTDTAQNHREQFDLARADFDVFLDTFLETLKEFDEGSEEMNKGVEINPIPRYSIHEGTRLATGRD